MKDDICHAITQCVKSVDAANLMLPLIQKIHPTTITGDVMFLQWNAIGFELPLMWLAINSIHIIWAHQLGGGISAEGLYTELMANHCVLKNSLFKHEARIIATALY